MLSSHGTAISLAVAHTCSRPHARLDCWIAESICIACCPQSVLDNLPKPAKEAGAAAHVAAVGRPCELLHTDALANSLSVSAIFHRELVMFVSQAWSPFAISALQSILRQTEITAILSSQVLNLLPAIDLKQRGPGPKSHSQLRTGQDQAIFALHQPFNPHWVQLRSLSKPVRIGAAV